MADTAAPSDHGSESRGRKARSKGNVFSRLALFIRQVVAELRKVIWPTRKELTAYTTVVVVFVVVMAAIIAAMDFIFTKGVLLVFG